MCGDYGQKLNIVLCNPAIKDFKLLPESQLALSSPESFPTAAVGFGCDLRLRNYKVVRLTHILDRIILINVFILVNQKCTTSLQIL